MPHSRKDVFIKSWIWSVVTSMVTAAIFWLVTDLGNIFHWEYGGTVFIDLLFGFTVFGGYVGAGYIGWSIADKYYPGNAKFFLKQYRTYSLLSFLAFVAIIFSPVSILGFLWSAMAPACVLRALSQAKYAGHTDGLPVDVISWNV